jgi:hypothetical protein
MDTSAKLPCPKIVRGQERLLPEQEAYAREFARARISALLSTSAIDEQEAEEHLRKAYQAAGVEPVPVRWFDSPLSFVAAYHADGWASTRDSVWASIWASVGDNVVRNIVGDGVWTGVWDNVWASVGDNVWASVGDNVVWNTVWAMCPTVEVGVGDSAWASEGISLEASVGAYDNAGWLAHYAFFHEVFEEHPLIHLARFNEMVSGYYLGKREAWLVRKPIRLERDERGRLHSAEGMCVQYRDGWGFYAWHGVRCSERIILHPESITREEWMEEINLERRRVIQERLGPERFLEVVGGRVLETGSRGSLIEVDLGGDPERVARFVRVTDSSTSRQYSLRVPPTIDSADEAVAWTFGLDSASYHPLQET